MSATVRPRKGAWIAVRGTMEAPAWLLWLAVTVWIAGFDLLYACQDVEFDRREGLHSVPARFGIGTAIRVSRVMHMTAVVAMAVLWRAADLPPLYLVGVALVSVLLAYEQSLVSERDLSRVRQAFDLNGYVGILYFAATALSLFWP